MDKTAFFSNVIGFAVLLLLMMMMKWGIEKLYAVNNNSVHKLNTQTLWHGKSPYQCQLPPGRCGIGTDSIGQINIVSFLYWSSFVAHGHMEAIFSSNSTHCLGHVWSQYVSKKINILLDIKDYMLDTQVNHWHMHWGRTSATSSCQKIGTQFMKVQVVATLFTRTALHPYHVRIMLSLYGVEQVGTMHSSLPRHVVIVQSMAEGVNVLMKRKLLVKRVPWYNRNRAEAIIYASGLTVKSRIKMKTNKIKAKLRCVFTSYTSPWGIWPDMCLNSFAFSCLSVWLHLKNRFSQCQTRHSSKSMYRWSCKVLLWRELQVKCRKQESIQRGIHINYPHRHIVRLKFYTCGLQKFGETEKGEMPISATEWETLSYTVFVAPAAPRKVHDSSRMCQQLAAVGWMVRGWHHCQAPECGEALSAS